MKWIFTEMATLAFALTICQVSSAGNDLLTYGHASDLNERQTAYYQNIAAQATTVSHYVVYLDPNVLLEEEEVSLNLPGREPEQLRLTRRKQNAPSLISIFGEVTGKWGQVNIVVDGISVRMMVITEQTIWNICPVSERAHILFQTDQSMYPLDETHEGYDRMQEQARLTFEIDDTDDFGDAAMKATSNMPGSCKIRIGVIYTDDAAAAYASVRSEIQMAINVTNSAYANSFVNTEVELAFAFERSFNESGDLDDDLALFWGTQDPILPDIHDLRNVFNADIMHFLVNSGSGCGVALQVGSTSGNAFCVTKISCAVSNFTFAHEQAHLFGCRHDLAVDPTPTPYLFGHGKTASAISQRTVMAYNTFCEIVSSGCQRVPYFSNPAINFPNSSLPTGSSTFENNQAVLDLEDNNVIAYRADDFTQTFSPVSIIIDDEELVDVYGINAINANAPQFSIENGGITLFRAGNTIEIQPGFHAKVGSQFETLLDNCTNNTNPPQKEPEVISNIDFNESDIDLRIHPNPFDAQTTLFLQLSEPSVVSILIRDLAGREVLSLARNEPLPAGILQWPVQSGHLSAGTYICLVNVNGISEQMKMILSR